MRILMFGRGVIATIYGGLLQSAGHEVEFYVRPGRASEYGDEVELDLIDARRTLLGTRVRHQLRLRMRESLDPDDAFDLIVLSVGHHQLSTAAAFLAPRVANATVLVFGNVWDEPLDAIRPLPAGQVAFGFPMAGGGFGADGVLRGALFRGLILGSAGTSATSREIAVQTAFRQAGLTPRMEKDLRGWLWLHFIADAGMYAQGNRTGGLASMIGDRQALRDALLTGRELLPVLHARGVDLGRHRRAALPFRLPTPTAAAMAWATARLPLAHASLAAHTDPNAAEPQAILRDVLHEVRRLGVPTPRLDAALSSPSTPAG